MRKTFAKIRDKIRSVANTDDRVDDSSDEDDPPERRKVAYESQTQSASYGLLYKRDKFCERCRKINWWSAMRQAEQRNDHKSSIPLYDKPVKLIDLRGCSELGGRIYWSLMQHPELKHDCDKFSVCKHPSHEKGAKQEDHECRWYGECQHEAHIMLESEELKINLAELDGDFNVEIKAPSAAYEAAVVKKTGDAREEIAKEQTESERTLDNAQIARYWLKECQEHHASCKGPGKTDANTPLPTRVIDVQHTKHNGTPNARLVETNGDHGQYATLSYVWGRGPRFVSSQESLKQMSSGINIGTLPKLFQDAIAFTREIGTPYLWIDVLCIIQDSADDLNHELSLMTDIYQYSSLTLAAVGQRSVHNDLIRNGKISRVIIGDDHHYKSYLECATKDGYFITYLAFGHPATLLYPLHTRAWCLQETLPSQRVLVLGLREMYWFCNAYERRASTFESKRKREPGDYEIEIYGPVTPEKVTSQDLQKRPFNFLYHTIAKYSNRQLSFPSDRVPAISGLARLLETEYLTGQGSDSAATGDGGGVDYLAGLWRQDLFHGLLWRNNHWRSDGYGFSKPDDLMMKFSAPSWSWAAWEIEASWRRHIRYEGPSAGEKRDAPLAEILSCSVNLVNPAAPYGQLSGGELVIEGRIAPLRFRDGKEPDEHNASYAMRKFCACEIVKYDPEYCRKCDKYLNAPVLVDQACVVLQMTQWGALVLSPIVRAQWETASVTREYGGKETELNKDLGLGGMYLRAGILVSVSNIELEWSKEKVVVTII